MIILTLGYRIILTLGYRIILTLMFCQSYDLEQKVLAIGRCLLKSFSHWLLFIKKLLFVKNLRNIPACISNVMNQSAQSAN